MSKPIAKLVANIGEYQKDGETKKRRVRIGTVFMDDHGRRSMVFDVIPVGQHWSGWAQEYPLDDDRRDEPTTTRNVHDQENGRAY